MLLDPNITSSSEMHVMFIFMTLTSTMSTDFTMYDHKSFYKDVAQCMFVGLSCDLDKSLQTCWKAQCSIVFAKQPYRVSPHLILCRHTKALTWWTHLILPSGQKTWGRLGLTWSPHAWHILKHAKLRTRHRSGSQLRKRKFNPIHML